MYGYFRNINPSSKGTNLLLAALLQMITAPANASCPSSNSIYNGYCVPNNFICRGVESSCYFFHRELYSWTDAQNQCMQMNLTLAVIDVSSENSFLKDTINSRFGTNPYESWWIGGTDAHHEGEWVWKTGNGEKSMTFTDWLYGEPSNFNDAEHYLHMWGVHNLQWNDAMNSEHFFSICETKKMDCGPPKNIINGEVSYDSTIHLVGIAVYKCDEGFVFIGSETALCMHDGAWSSQDQFCQEIDICASNPCQNGATCKNRLHGFDCTCPIGYSGTTCSDVIDCEMPEDIANGLFEVSSTIYPIGHAFYFCNLGYSLQGTGISLCTQTGNWSNEQQFCEEIDECLSNPCQNGGFCKDEINGFTCECLTGYVGDVCTTGVDCASPSLTENGSVVFMSSVYPTGMAYYSCFEGYILDGEDLSYCTDKGKWSGKERKCEEINECAMNPCQNGGECIDEFNGYNCLCRPGYHGDICNKAVDCGEPPQLKNGDVDFTTTLYPFAQAFYSCKKGFTLAGSMMSFCPKTGKWSKIERSCIEIDECTSHPCQNGGMCENHMDGFSCFCSSGFHGLVCSEEIDECASNPCLNGGSCIEQVNNYICICEAGFRGFDCSQSVDCGVPTSLPNGSFDYVSTTYPTGLAVYACNKGFQLNGNQSTICTYTGLWSDQKQICKEIDECSSNPCLNGGTCRDLINGFNCECMIGYGGDICSKGIDCGKPKMIQNGSVQYASTVYPSGMAVFTCDHGFILNGSLNSFCTTGGVWSGQENICTAIDCGPPKAITNGLMKYSSTMYPTGFAVYFCNDGYTLHGSNVVSCTISRQWTNQNQFCEEKDECASSPCQNGGTCIDGLRSFSCQCVDGYEGTLCSEGIDCGDPLQISHSYVNYSSTSFPQGMASYFCKPGYRLVTDGTSFCTKTGKWSNENQLCEERTCLSKDGTLEECEEQRIDLAFIIDESGSITPPNFKKMISLVKNIISELDVRQGFVHLSVVLYNEDQRVAFRLHELFSKEEIHQALDDVTYMGGSTETGDALDFVAIDIFLPGEQKRANITNYAILLTDEKQIDLQSYVESMERVGIKLFALHIVKDFVSDKQWLKLNRTTYQAHSFDYLNDDLVKKIAHDICT